MVKQAFWRDSTRWAVVLSFVGLGALLLGGAACQQSNAASQYGDEKAVAEAAGRAFWAVLGAIAAEVAAVILSIRGLLRLGSIRGLLRLGRRGLKAVGLTVVLLLVLIVGALVLLASLFLGLLVMFGVCSGTPL